MFSFLLFANFCHANFENFEDTYNTTGGDFDPKSTGAGMSVNRSFDDVNTITKASNMNNVVDEDEDFMLNSDTQF